LLLDHETPEASRSPSPVAFSRRPGWKLDWQEAQGQDEIIVRVIPDRAERARRLFGAGKDLAPGSDAVADLVAERESEG
jgi:hypothetical protein